MHKSVTILRAADAAYIAGLVDGEGTVTLSRLHRHEHRRIVITISNNDYRLLDFVLSTVGAGKITGKRLSRENHSPSFTWQIASRQALEFLKQIHPYLRTYKEKRATLALNEYLACTPRNGKYDDATLQRRLEFEERFLSLKPNIGMLKHPNSIDGSSDD